MPGNVSGIVQYNPSDPKQTALLNALANVETGQRGSVYLGYGNVDLSSAPRDQYGFPQWGGSVTSAGPTHAAGLFQFQPGTWDRIAATYGLDFSKPQDQAAGAWYLSQEDYARNTGGRSLTDALAAGDYTSVQSGLTPTFAGAPGNASSPGVAAQLAASNADPAASDPAYLHRFDNVPGMTVDPNTGKATGTTLPGDNSPPVGTTQSGGMQLVEGYQKAAKEWLDAIENWVERFALLIIGGAIVFVALWILLADQGVVPGPADVAKAASKAAMVV